MSREIPQDIRDTFPYEGDKLTFVGVPERYYPMFLDMGENARQKLHFGQEYEIRKIEIYSSWCAIWLVGVGGDEDYFNLSFFEKEDWLSKGSAHIVTYDNGSRIRIKKI